MGHLVSRLLATVSWPTNRQMRILMLGLDNAGKTTILYKLRVGETVSTIPTIGFNVEHLEHKNVSFVVWDVGGQDRIRPLWQYYYTNTEALVFVVDSNDRERATESSDELHKILSDDRMRDVKVLVYANKSDLPHAMSPAELTEKLELRSLRNRSWYIQSCCATDGDGLLQGLDWLASVLKNR